MEALGITTGEKFSTELTAGGWCTSSGQNLMAGSKRSNRFYRNRLAKMKVFEAVHIVRVNQRSSNILIIDR